MADLFQNATDAAQFCTNCGKEIQQGTKFCAFCGTQIISTAVVNKESSALAEPLTDSVPEHKSSFFGWGKARKPVLFFVWVFVLALAAEQLYYVWADSKPSMEHGPAMAFWAGILAAMYAPKRRFFGVLWFFIGLVGSVLALGLLSGFVRLFR
jgi:hypothetical protein